MKKLLSLIIVFILLNIEIGCRKSSASYEADRLYSVYSKEEIEINGMKYLFIYRSGGNYQTGYAIDHINLTKDSLEVALLLKQLK